jgi:D-proline reductase (dithiol) PrdB
VTLRSSGSPPSRSTTTATPPASTTSTPSFPITHLQDLAKDGTIGGLAPRFQKIFPNYSHRVTMTRDAPEVLAQLRADEVDAALLVPV